MRNYWLCSMAGLLGGCFAPTIGDGQYACGPDGQCPPGFSCSSSLVCEVGEHGVGHPDAGADAEVAVDATFVADRSAALDVRPDLAAKDLAVLHDAAIPQVDVDVIQGVDAPAPDLSMPADLGTDVVTMPACVPSSVVPSDNFDDGVVNMTLWGKSYSAPGASLAEVGGAAVFVLSGVSGLAYAGYESSDAFDLTGQRVFAEFPHMVNLSTHAQGSLFVQDGDLALTMIQENGALGCLIANFATGAFTFHGTVNYDPTLHQWWQLREDSGTAYCEVSADGISWLPLGQLATPAFLTSANVGFQAGTYQAETEPGELHVDNFNVCP